MDFCCFIVNGNSKYNQRKEVLVVEYEQQPFHTFTEKPIKGLENRHTVADGSQSNKTVNHLVFLFIIIFVFWRNRVIAAFYEGVTAHYAPYCQQAPFYYPMHLNSLDSVLGAGGRVATRAV